MGTRYKWTRQSYTTNEVRSTVLYVKGLYNSSGATGSNVLVGYCSTAEYSNQDQFNHLKDYNLSGAIVPLYVGQWVDASTYKYFSPTKTGSPILGHAFDGGHWLGTNYPYTSDNNQTGAALYSTNSTSSGTQLKIVQSVLEGSGTGSKTTVTSAVPTAYPTGADTNKQYWYDYVGSDNPDVTNISYSTANVKPGQTLTLTVFRGSDTSEVTYDIQVKRNGGNWATIGTAKPSSGTTFSTTYTVPEGTTSLQFRAAAASDNYGWTSNTYIAGASIAINTLSMWVGISDKARKGMELYVGVNGKARKVTAAYIGVNGKARRFL